MTINYKIEFFEYWNTASGLSGGAKADILTLKDRNGFPYVPGKTVKGLLREAAETIAGFSKDDFVSGDFVTTVFGEESLDSNTKEDKTYSRREGTSFFTNAVLSEETVNAIKENKHFLFEEIAATAIEESGLIKQHSLRRTEFALPCTLYGQIHHLPDQYKEQLQICFQFIKRLGYNRNRGYGRCHINVI